MVVENVQNSASWTAAALRADDNGLEMTFKLEPRRLP